MSGSSPRQHPERIAAAAAYTVLGAALLWSRLAHLGHSFWTDEILMISAYVREGPSEILAGPELSHELMALLTWLTGLVTGDSEIAFRLWSALPFIAGVVVATTWLHRRISPLSGVLFLFLSTVSPLLLDISRQARGYGIAYAAMCVLVVGALEARRTARTWAVAVMCATGVVGTWTLPQVGIAFVATGLALVTVREVRRPAVIGLAASIVAIAAWYAPHIGAVRASSQVADGVHFHLPWVLTAPIDQVLLPALLWIDGTVIIAGLVWLPLVLLAVIVIAASPLLRDRASALILCSGVVATAVAFWIGEAYVIPRYISYLGVPLYVLLATGAAAILGRIRTRPALFRTLVCLVVLGVLTVRFAMIAPDVVALPREANRDAADVIDARATPTRVLAYMRNPQNVEYYLGRAVEDLRNRDIAAIVCGQDDAVFYVTQPFALEDVPIPCSDRPGVEHDRFRMYARGYEINVWFVPPAG
jgi:hypothetical protein